MFGGSQLFASQGVAFGGTQGATQGEGSAAKKARPDQAESCLPVTIRQMELALTKRADSGEDLKFFGSEPKELIVVAAVESVARQGTSLEMTLNDSTGRMKARYFVTEAQPGDLDRIVPGRYICAFGGARSAPAVHFAINGLRLVESADEVSYHMIEVAHAALRLQLAEKATDAMASQKVEGGPFSSPVKPAQAASFAAAAGAFSSPPRIEAFASPGGGDAPSPPAKAPAAGPLQGAELRAALLAALREVEGAEGCSVAAAASKLGVAEPEVRKCIVALVGDGEVFQTIDDNHFAVL